MVLKKWIIPVLWMTIIGIILVGLTWILYVGIYLSIESLWYKDNPQGFPADHLRLYSSLFLLVLYIVSLKYLKRPLIKSILLIPATCMILITVILRYYDRLIIGVPVLIFLLLMECYLLYRFKQPWMMYYASLYAGLIALLYAFPR